MKLKAIREIVYNLCDKVKSNKNYFTDNIIPEKGKWIINLKSNVIDEIGKEIKLSFLSELHELFKKELAKANMLLEDMDKADLIIEFGHKYKNLVLVLCEVIVSDRTYRDAQTFYLWD
jgi:hypothetical protein